MANTMHGPFTKGASTTTGSYGTGGGQVNTYSSGNANNGETQSATALSSFNPDLIGSGFVLSGVTSAKDVTVASQLDVASGEAYLVVSDGTVARCDVTSTTFSTTGNPSTTLYLFLKNDGTWQWGTTSTGPTNSLAICQVTTDAGSNIATVTDKRSTLVTLLAGMVGNVAIPNQLYIGGASGAHFNVGSNAVGVWTPQSGPAWALQFLTWNGSALKLPFSIGTPATGSATMMSDTGGFSQIANQATAGSFGAPVIVAQALNVHVTTTALTTILSYTPSAAGLYRLNASFNSNNGATNHPNLQYSYTGGSSNTALTNNFTTPNGSVQNGAQIGAGNADIALTPQTLYLAAAAVTVSYQNNSGTPSDYVTVIIERLS